MFKVNSIVYCDYYKLAGTVTSLNSGSANYPIQVRFDNGTTDNYTTTGSVQVNSKPTLRIAHPSVATDQYSVIKIERLASLITLSDGTRIYHPDSGQPFQLTSKETLI